jgi:hypothetical protein
MSDSAFANHAFPSCTIVQLVTWIRDDKPSNPVLAKAMIDEIIRRNFRAMGDVSIMSAGERLRHIRATR